MDSFKTIEPDHRVIAKCIAYYYFHDSQEEHFKKDIIYHPHYLTALNVYKGVKIKWHEHGKTYVPTTSDEKEIILTINNKTSKEISLSGAFHKIGIVFYPLGINHFITDPLNSIVSNTRASNFDYFGDEFISTTNAVFETSDLEEKRDVLDAFFNNRFTPFKEKRVTVAVDTLLKASKMPKTQELADRLAISRKTLLRLFKMHLCFSVEEFKSVVKFRKALHFYEESNTKPKLSHVAYDNEYYDQSDFINHFKAITGLNPSKFFSSINNISSNGTYWTFKRD